MTVKDGPLAGFAVLIAVHAHRHARIVIECGQQVRVVAAIVEVGKTAG